MRRCEDCKIILDSDVSFCPKCGKDIASPPRAKPDPIMTVPKLLAAANLHKSRQEWDEAIASATDALRMEPKNADVAVVLGSIYEEREMFDEALVWYQMALEMDPDNGKAKAGRERVGMLVSARRRAAAAAPKAMAKQTKYIAAGVGGLILLVIVLLTVFSMGNGHKLKPTVDIKPNPHVNSPVTQPHATRPSAAAPVIASEPLSGASTTAGGSKTSGLRTAAEDGIRNALSSGEAVATAGATVDDVIADPRTGVATVTFSVPLRGMVTREQISRAAVAVGRKTFESNQYVKFVTARCLIPVPGSQGSQIAFVGDIARESAAGKDDQQMAAAFSNVWWNPQIR